MNLIAHGELLATFSAAHSEHTATVLGGHALTESVLVVALPVVGLECSLHDYSCFCFSVWKKAYASSKKRAVAILRVQK